MLPHDEYEWAVVAVRQLRSMFRALLFTPGLVSRVAPLSTSLMPRPFWGFARGAVGGPNVRTRRMIDTFGNHPFSPNIVYAQSGWNMAALDAAARYRRRTNVPLVFNQNGWYYPGWFKGDHQVANQQLVQTQTAADYVFFQSRFCLEAGRHLTGFEPSKYEVLYNAVPPMGSDYNSGGDGRTCWLSAVFTPDAEHILRPALKAFAILHKRLGTRATPRLHLAGRIDSATRQAVWFQDCRRELADLEGNGTCKWLGEYRTQDLPALLRRVDLALHLKYKDPCPNAVIERLNFRLPHVYSNSGGTPELIADAGVALPVEDRWDRQVSVEPVDLADAILEGLACRSRLSDAAHERSKYFAWDSYIARHAEVFRQLLKYSTHD